MLTAIGGQIKSRKPSLSYVVYRLECCVAEQRQAMFSRANGTALAGRYCALGNIAKRLFFILAGILDYRVQNDRVHRGVSGQTTTSARENLAGGHFRHLLEPKPMNSKAVADPAEDFREESNLRVFTPVPIAVY